MKKKLLLAVISLIVLSTFASSTPQVLAEPEITWVPTTSLPEPRAEHISVAYEERIYVLGGYVGYDICLDSVYYCDVNPNGTIDSWHTTTSLPDGRSETATLAYGGYVYLLGGKSLPGPTWQSEVWYAQIQAEGSLGSWSSTTSLPRGVGGHGAFEWNGRLYVLGGWTGGSFRRETYFAEANPDGSLGSWTSTSLLPEARGHGISAIAHNGYAYALGGQGPDLADKADVWYAMINSDGTLDSWTSTTSMPTGLTTHTVAIINNEIYIIGGTTHPPWMQRSEVYRAPINLTDGTLGAWIRDTDLALPIGIEPRGHLYNQAPVVNNRIYVVGGRSNKATATNTVYYTEIKAEPPPPRQLSVKVYGAHDYSPWENVKVKIWALVADVSTMELVSDANVTITIYDPEDNLWINDTMTEKLNHGIYLWESTETVRQIFYHHKKGVYLVHVEASYGDGPTATDILTFHIDPPPEESNQLPIIIGTTITSIAILAVAILYIIKKQSP